MPKKINIFLKVIDNLGDIGFACELLRSFNEASRGKYFFDIWTDETEKVEAFFSKNEEIKGSYAIHQESNISEKTSSLSFLLFHSKIPKDYPFSKNELFLRIDYLSFNAEWIKNHGKEHISSREGKKIIEIIPSPLEGGGGIIFPPKTFHSREELAPRYGIDPEKKWVSIFSYKKTLEDCLEIEPLKNTEILLFGADFSIVRNDRSITPLPFLSLTEFASIIHESTWAIVRGEVSFITTIAIGTPFFWDMYKEIGGYHHEQAGEFLDWTRCDDNYRNIFDRLNGQIPGGLNISEIDSYFLSQSSRKKGSYKNLREELEKYIDKYYISL